MSGQEGGRLNPVDSGNTWRRNSGANVQISKSFQQPKKVGNRGEGKPMGSQRKDLVRGGSRGNIDF